MKICNLNDLPDDILLEVFSRLPFTDMVTCALHVCAHWCRLFRFRMLWRGKQVYEAVEEAQADEAYRVARLISSGRNLTLEVGDRFHLRATEDSVTVCWDVFQQEKFEFLTADSRVENLHIPGNFLVWANVTSLARCMPQLRTLTVNNSVTDWPSLELPDAMVRLLGSGLLAELRSLAVEGASSQCVEMDETLVAACRGCPWLEELHLQWTDRLSSRGLMGLAACPHLRRLRISSVRSLTSLEFLPPGLCHLEVSCCPGVQLAQFGSPCDGCPRLCTLVLDSCTVRGPQLSEVALRLSSLELADLSGNRSLGDLSFLRPWLQLRSLNLSDCDSFNVDSFGTLCFLRELQVLNLCRCDLRNVSLDAVLSSLLHLEELNLAGAAVTQGHSIAYSLPPNLTKLQLSWCPWVDASVVQELRHSRQLRVLHLSRCGNVIGWQHLASVVLPRLPSLELLDLSGIGGSGGGSVRDLSFLCYCPQLRALDIGENGGLPPETYFHLRHVPSLHHLNLHGSNLENVPLIETVGHLSQLETLTLYGCRGIGQEEIQHLSSTLPKLIIKGKVQP